MKWWAVLLIVTGSLLTLFILAVLFLVFGIIRADSLIEGTDGEMFEGRVYEVVGEKPLYVYSKKPSGDLFVSYVDYVELMPRDFEKYYSGVETLSKGTQINVLRMEQGNILSSGEHYILNVSCFEELIPLATIKGACKGEVSYYDCPFIDEDYLIESSEEKFNEVVC